MNQTYKTIYNDKMLADTFDEFAIADAFVADKNGAHLADISGGQATVNDADLVGNPTLQMKITGDDTVYTVTKG